MWTNECEQAFVMLKNLCGNTPVLAYPNYQSPFKLYTDASESGLGAVLSQVQNDKKVDPLCMLNAHKLEFLAFCLAITDKFHEYFYGGKFEVHTDNNPLTYVLISVQLDAIGQRWLASLGPYNFSIHYNQGCQHVVADSLSRIPWEKCVFQDFMDLSLVQAMIKKGESKFFWYCGTKIYY